MFAPSVLFVASMSYEHVFYTVIGREKRRRKLIWSLTIPMKKIS